MNLDIKTTFHRVQEHAVDHAGLPPTQGSTSHGHVSARQRIHRRPRRTAVSMVARTLAAILAR
jgi:hypothetical protein